MTSSGLIGRKAVISVCPVDKLIDTFSTPAMLFKRFVTSLTQASQVRPASLSLKIFIRMLMSGLFDVDLAARHAHSTGYGELAGFSRGKIEGEGLTLF